MQCDHFLNCSCIWIFFFIELCMADLLLKLEQLVWAYIKCWPKILGHECADLLTCWYLARMACTICMNVQINLKTPQAI